MAESPFYPVNLTVDYPDRELDRVSTFFRLFAAIPIVIVLALLSGGDSWENQGDADGFQLGTAGPVFAPTVLMLVFRKKYPRW